MFIRISLRWSRRSHQSERKRRGEWWGFSKPSVWPTLLQWMGVRLSGRSRDGSQWSDSRL